MLNMPHVTYLLAFCAYHVQTEKANDFVYDGSHVEIPFLDDAHRSTQGNTSIMSIHHVHNQT